ncbi:RHS repeat-associated core domain-containing protein [Streptomyces sp. NPDC096030]|uniref:RHS repeat-associated core domain-containing protein n=1 Tax=Streptomyces sp. NPDC096030 TaxID=3155423 RepID=UPI00332CFA64
MSSQSLWVCSGAAGSGTARSGWLRRCVVAMAVVVAVTAVPVVTAGAVPSVAAAAAGEGASGAVALGGGAVGGISERTGAFSVMLPLVSLPGRGDAGVELALVYDQGAAGAGADRHGLGQGMGLGKAFIDPGDGGTLHTPGGGSYRLRPGDTEGTGLQRYLLKDLALREQPGTLPARDGAEDMPRAYRWVLAYDDGRKNFFSAEGDLVAEQDVFGHETAYAWNTGNGQHRLERAVDAWGQAVTFGYSREHQVTVTSPVRSDGKQPQVVLHLDAGRLTEVTYPEDQTVRLAWDHTPEGQPGRLLTRVEAPAGAVTRIGYDSPHGFPVASSLRVTDQQGKNLTPERTFRLGSEGEHAGHDFTGRGQYESADALFDSADADYRYATELSDGSSTVRSVYNSLHLLKERTATLEVNGEQKPVRTQELAYEGEREDGQAPPAPSALPANYGKPVRATVTVHDPATGKSRTTAETARFDEHGREVERTDVTGAKTVTEYDPTALGSQSGEQGAAAGSGGGGQDSGPAGYGLPVKVTVTGADGAESVTENTLTGDRKSIASTRQLVKNKDEERATARTVTAFQTDGHGEVTGKTVTWADGAKPDGVQGPDEVTETYETAVDTAAHTRTATVKSAAGTSSQVTDLVTGQVIRTTGTEGRTAETGYDLAGRPVTQKAPGGPDGDGLVTTTSYTPATTTVSSPGQDGEPHITTEHRDLLGRAVKQTDNVRGGELTGDPAARTLQTVTFTDEGRTAQVTDQAGRTTVITSDALGRPVKTVAPNGMTRLTVYADAATADTSTVTTLALPAGETDPARAVATGTETADQADRPVASASSFADGTRQSGSSQSYDGLGRVAGAVSQEVAAAPSYGPAGTPAVTTLTPQNTGEFPGQKITASVPQDLTGADVVKTLLPGQHAEGAEGRSGRTAVRDAAGRVLEERRPDGTKTAFTYAPGGQVKETVSPSGIRTAYHRDEATAQVLEVTVTSADGKTTEKTGYTYDPHTGAVTSVYDPDDTGGSRISYTYDADGNITSVTYPDGKSVRQEYGDDGQLEKTTDTAGLTTFYTYSSDGTLARAVQHERDDTRSAVRASVAYTYDGFGRITRTDRGNGVTTEAEFTDAHQIRHEKTTRDGKMITEAGYTYDSHNNLTARTDTRPQTGLDGTPGQPVTTTTRYTYDAYNRLTGSDVQQGTDGRPLTATRYTLNVSGDVIRTETTPRTGGQAGKTEITEHGIDTSGRLSVLTVNGEQRAQVFDTDGNLTTSHEGTRWTYSLTGRPVTQTRTDGTTVHHTYWADGTRATRTETVPASDSADSGGSMHAGAVRERTAVFHYSPDGTLVNDTHTADGTGDTGVTQATGGDGGAGYAAGRDEPVTASYLLAGARHARTLTGAGQAATGEGYLIADRHGNTTALTDGRGDVTQAWQYTDYGQHADHTGAPHPGTSTGPAGAARQPFAFAGEYTDPGGVQYLKTRLYDPAVKRFTTPDGAPQFNRYQAFDANPVTRTDPDGTTSQLDWGLFALSAAFYFASVVAVAAMAATGGLAAVGTASLIGLAAETAGMAMETAALADASENFLTPRIRKDLMYSGTALAVLGSLPSIGKGMLRLTGRMDMTGSVTSAGNAPRNKTVKGAVKYIFDSNRNRQNEQVTDNCYAAMVCLGDHLVNPEGKPVWKPVPDAPHVLVPREAVVRALEKLQLFPLREKSFSRKMSVASAEAAMSDTARYGEDAVFMVTIHRNGWRTPLEGGHYLNALNTNGRLEALDGQIDEVKDFQEYFKHYESGQPVSVSFMYIGKLRNDVTAAP